MQLLLCSRTVTALVEELGPPAEGHPAVPAAGRSLAEQADQNFEVWEGEGYKHTSPSAPGSYTWPP